jgi:putative ABC transport system substrate-binding protein
MLQLPLKGRKTMRRREFITLAGGAVAAWPLAARAQQASKRPTVALILVSPSALIDVWSAAFIERLRELGWTAGRNVAIEHHWSEERPERVTEIAAEVVRQKVDVIFTYGNIAATFKQATTSIPIVLIANDPVGSGFVASLSRPGGNITGLSLQAPESAGKRLELLRQLVPSLRRLAILFVADYPAAVLEKDNVQAAARNLGLEVEQHGTRRPEDIAPVFDALKADALYVVGNAANGARIAALALNMRLPTTFEHVSAVRDAGLMSYGPDLTALFRRAADFVDKILRGAKPGELPIEQPTKFNLAINLKTAEALGLDVPMQLQQLADEVIE